MLEKKFRIMNAFLQQPFTQLYGRAIERLSKVTHSRAVAYLKDLADQKVLSSKKSGNQVHYSLNPNNEITIKALSIAEFERKEEFFNDKPIERSIMHRLVLASLDKYPDSIQFCILFGSFARDQARESSDLDVLFVVSRHKNIKPDLERIAKDLTSSTGRKISVHAVEIQEIEKAWLEEPAYKGIWKDRIVLFGQEQFWRFVLRMGDHQ